MAGRFESLNSGGRDGYDTTSKNTFDHEVSFTLDYSDMELGIKDARDMVADFGKEIKASMVGIKTPKGSNFVYANSDFKNAYTATSAELLFPRIVTIDKDMNALGQAIAAEAKTSIKKYIGSRVDTGTMKGSVFGRTKRSKGKVVARAGWLDLWYKYFGYQEEGTSTISPMHSILRTYLELAPEVQKISSEYIRKSTKSGGFKG